MSHSLHESDNSKRGKREYREAVKIGQKAMKEVISLARQSVRQQREELRRSKRLSERENKGMSGPLFLKWFCFNAKAGALTKISREETLSEGETDIVAQESLAEKGFPEANETALESESQFLTSPVENIAEQNVSEFAGYKGSDFPKETGNIEEKGIIPMVGKKQTNKQQEIAPGRIFRGKVALLVLPVVNSSRLAGFIEAIKNIPEMKLILVGWTDSEGVEVLVSLEKEMALVDVLHETGLVKNIFEHTGKLAVLLKEV